MPIYEYECEKCGVVEAIQKFDAEPLEKCPNCGKSKPKKLLSASAFHLKGGGWYKTDYASSSGGAKSSDDSASKTKKEGGESKSGDSAAAAKPEAKKKCGSGCGCH